MLATRMTMAAANSIVVPATVSYTDVAGNTSDLATYTFSTRAIGTAASNRVVFVTVGFQGPNSTAVSSLTVGGSGASLVVANDTSYGGAMSGTEIWKVSFTTGTTATIVVNFNATANDCSIGLFAAYGIAGTAHATNTSSAGPPSASLAIPANGIAIGSCYDNNGATTATWSNLTERFDSTASGNLHTGASDAFASSSTPTIGCTPSAYFAPRLALCSFGPG